MKKIFYLCLILTLILFSSCSDNNATHPSQIKKLKEVSLDIMTTNKFLYNMTKDITKDNHFVDYMFNGAEAQWNFIYTNDSLQNVGKQDLFIYSGAGFEPWIDDFLNKLNRDNVGAIDASRGIKLLNVAEPVKYHNTDIKENPYYWLDISNYKTALLNIKNAIEDKDPEKRNIYESNFNKSIEELKPYEKNMKDVCDKYKDTTFLVEGDVLDYFTIYNNLKTLKFYDDRIIKKEEMDKLDKQLTDSKNIVFLYVDDDALRDNKGLLDKYSIKNIKLVNYDSNMKIKDILKYNATAMESYLENSAASTSK